MGLLYRTRNRRCRLNKHTNIRRRTIPNGPEVLKWAAMKTVSIGLVGLGGYAQTHLLALNTLQAAGACKVAAAADPFAERHAPTVAALQAQGAVVYKDIAELLARDDIDAVTIATPIPLHAPQTIAALSAGKSVYLEKPPCATIQELEAMIAAETAAAGPIARVGFQMQTSLAIRWLKEQILAGTWGALQSITSSVCWPRDDDYYNRSPWAAKWRQNGSPVFDGPATNALAHVVFAALYLGGETPCTVARPERVRGSLMRARPVESYDSSLVECELAGGARLSLAFTHATQDFLPAGVFVDCENARISLDWDSDIRIYPRDGSEPQRLKFQQATNHTSMHDFVRSVASGARGVLPTLEDARGFLELLGGALQSSAAATPGGSADFASHRQAGEGGKRVYVVDGLNSQMEAFAKDAAAVPVLFDIESKPWIAREAIGKTLAV